MVYHRVLSCALRGLDGIPVEIEVCVLPGLPTFEISGRGDSAIRESRDRVRAAIRNSGYVFPKGRVIASYAPAALPKQGSAFDLPLAVAILGASSQAVRPKKASPAALFGELSLNGRVKPVQGMFGRLLSLAEKGIRCVIGPEEGIEEAEHLGTVRYEGVRTLKEAVLRFSGVSSPTCSGTRSERSEDPVSADEDMPLFEMIRGQEAGIRACTIAAAGWHPLLMMGAPGCGKTTLASALPSLLPPLSRSESIELSKIYSAASSGAVLTQLVTRRPFRHTHHTVTAAALIGGGSVPRPGECTLAHRGVLFLDEVTEIRPDVLDALREPVETGSLHLARGDWHVEFPADFLLVAACNPCRCGYLLEPGDLCRCDDASVRRHLARISGPLYDRFDLSVLLRRVGADELAAPVQPRRTEDVSSLRQLRKAVAGAWEMQRARFRERHLGSVFNARVTVKDIADDLDIDADDVRCAARMADTSFLSARAFFSMLRVARTIADLDGRCRVTRDDIAEAYQYKQTLPLAARTGGGTGTECPA